MSQILIMSSDPILKKKNMDILMESGFRVFESSNALDGLLKVDKNDFDLIIIDEELTDMDGYEACKKIRQYSDIPIILLGAENEENVWARIEELGFDLYLKKPVSPRELMARVKAVLRRAPAKPKSKEKAKTFADTASARDEAVIQDRRPVEIQLQKIICPNCGTENRPGQRFCGMCATGLIPEVKPAPVEQPSKATAIQTAIQTERPVEIQPQKIICLNCGTENQPGQRFCGMCATGLIPKVKPAPVEQPSKATAIQTERPVEIQPQKIICPNCGAENPAKQNFCGTCATKLITELGIQTQAISVTTLQETRFVKLDKSVAVRPDKAQLAVKKTTIPEDTSLRVLQDPYMSKLIDALSSSKMAEINPKIDSCLEGGFGYPDVDRLLDSSDEETKKIIKRLAANDILERKPFDRLIVDPDGSFQIAPVEYCPQCGNGELTKGQLIEHFSCGNVGLDLDYKSGHKYICPRCKKKLHLLGTDYHYVLQYKCGNNHTFPKPVLKWHNLKTGKIWDPEQLVESWIYSYSLRPDKRDWLEFQLKPKAQLVDFLKTQGYQVEESAKVQGKSGAVHTIDILATRNDGLANYHVGIGILIAPSGEGEVPLEELFKFDTAAYDTGINYKILIAIPGLSTEAAKFADRQKIGVFEATEPSALISFLTSQTKLSPATLPGSYMNETMLMSSPKNQLVGFLRYRGYEVSEKATVIGRSGAEYVFDVLAQRDDAIVRPTIVVAFYHADGAKTVGIDKVSQFDAEAYDSGIQNKVLVGIPQVSVEGKQLAKQQRISVIDECDLESSLQSWSAER